MTPIVIPQVAQDARTATIVEWRKQPGDAVARGEVVLIIESDKAVFEIEAEASGRIERILEAAGSEVEVLKPVGYIDEAG